jgi:hypothetical protein
MRDYELSIRETLNTAIVVVVNPETRSILRDMAVTNEQIAQRAFEIWDREGRPEGRDQEHWFRAEAELTQQADGSARKPDISTNKPQPGTPAKVQSTATGRKRAKSTPAIL